MNRLQRRARGEATNAAIRPIAEPVNPTGRTITVTDAGANGKVAMGGITGNASGSITVQ